VRALLWPLFSWSAWAHSATVLAVTTSEGAFLASVTLVGVGSQQLRALLLRMLAWSACTQTATVVAGNTGERAALVSFRMVGVGSASHCRGGQDK
jgi:hypothetical protein